ncbi:MAG: glycosyltransferase family 4 protein [Chloroflexi bacterium]|nr:glycosyltransferase family 4 protein [Chloroflexota bacterium]
MRVAVLTRAIYPLHGYGGLERHAYHLCLHLARQGVEVELFTQPAQGPISDLLAFHGLQESVRSHFQTYPRFLFRTNSVPDRAVNYPRFSWNMGQAVRESISREPIDVVHAQGLCAFGYAWQRRWGSARAPLLFNPQGLEEFKSPVLGKRLGYLPFRILSRYAAARANYVIASDRCTQDEVRKFLGVPDQRIAVLPNAVDEQECRDHLSEMVQGELVERFDLNGRWPILLSVGRLEANKGFQVLPEVASYLNERLEADWVWLLVGDGSRRPEIREGIARRRLEHRFLLVGSLTDAELHNLYERSDLFVHPTLYEGSSLVTLEAMMHAKPVVASAVGGIPDKVIPERNGYLCQPGNVRELSENIERALEDQQRLAEMGRESHRIATEEFSWTGVAAKTIAVYEDMLSRKPRR